jgi:hypothetical protein
MGRYEIHHASEVIADVATSLYRRGRAAAEAADAKRLGGFQADDHLKAEALPKPLPANDQLWRFVGSTLQKVL